MKKLLAFLIIFLFIGMSTVSLSGNQIKYVNNNEYILDAFDSFEELLVRGHIAYAYITYDPSGQLGTGPVKFELDNPGDLTKLSNETVPGFPSGSAWTWDGKWLVCDYNIGALYEIDPETGAITEIGGGGTGMNGLALDPATNQLYGASGNGATGGLWKIDQETGEQEYVGDFESTAWIFDMAFDEEGICYGIGFNGELYTIDLSTGEATFICNLINCTSPSELEFDLDNDILYIIGYTTGFMTGLYTCDTETWECNFVGQFEGGVELIALAIPYNSSSIPPATTISFHPPEPDGCNGWYVSNVTVALNAIDQDGVNTTYFRIKNRTWETYDSPFVISEEGEDILIEFYSVDIYGNIEKVKSSTLKIDRTPPNITVEWEVKRIGWRKWQVTFSINITNEPSCMNRIDIYFNDVLQETIVGPGPTYSWSFIICGGNHTLMFVTMDQACNQAIVIVNLDIKSRSYSKSFNTHILSNMLLWEFLGIQMLQKLLVWMVSGMV